MLPLHMLLPPISSSSALDTIPSASELRHNHQDTEPMPQPPNNIQPNQPPYSEAGHIYLRDSIPPIPAKLVKRIQEESLIEMSEFSPELLRNATVVCQRSQQYL